MIAFLWN